MRRPWLPSAVVPGAVVLVLLALGAGVALAVGSALGLSFHPAAVPVERPVAAPAPAGPAAVVGKVEAPDDPVIQAAARTVPVKPGGPTLQVSVTPTPGGFRLTGHTLQAATPADAATALYAIADRVRSAEPLTTVVPPRLGLRLTDLGSVGITPDPAAFAAGTDYSLATSPLRDAIRPGPPYLDPAAVSRLSGQFRQLVDHDLAQGYNGVVVSGFLEYLTFGDAVYPAGDQHRDRARAMVAVLGPVWRYAHDKGMKVFFAADMVTETPPLKAYLDRSGQSVEDPGFWRIYQAGLAEFFRALPYADGLMIRIGEGGDVYKTPGQDISSSIGVTTPKAVRTMLTALLDTAGRAGKDIIFRSWTVGVGAVGDLHTNPASYDEVLGGLHDPHLIVSTKYTAGDFYSHLPLNETLLRGDQRRIVEFQARREFEGFGSLPNDLGAVEQQALQRFLAANPHIEGVWNWTQDGGPLRAGPMSLHLRAGFWQLADLNTYVTARLAADPSGNPGQYTADWVRQTFSTDPATVRALTQVFALSREAITKGLYIGPYADQTVKALGLSPPPMMWIFEWDIVTGDSAALDSIYAVSAGHLDEAIAEGDQAIAAVGRMRALVDSTPAGSWRDPVLRQRFVATLDYETSLFDTLGAYRTMVLRHAQWLSTGQAYDEWKAAEGRYQALRADHVRRYAGNVDLPAYNFTAADLGSARADRDPVMAWLARGLLAALVVGLVAGHRTTVVRALWTGATQPWRLAPEPVTRTDRVLVIAIPAVAVVLSRAIFTWFASPAHLVLTLGSWLLYALVLRSLVRRVDAFALWAALGGAALLRTVILLLGLVARGPGKLWFEFWTDPGVRLYYLTVAFAAFLWVFVACGAAMRGRQPAGRVLIAVGVPAAVFGGLVSLIGLEQALTWWNDQLAVLPWGLSRILGLTVYLGIPEWLPVAVAGFGLALILAGGLTTWTGRRRAATLGA
ncbi:glycosyl hydrolase family 67 [Labedaea rhizosphaerae]|uniref:Glycosyl hydrolase family 67 n=2 Tax=Labedaea rhizosphaerae TaxID=598644 RepID=A0A4R6SDY7_LABRH|nr:hypothetical protein [Labedaea rhizosphaerae]TDP98200.1 glycosyl hydrolase family 67 [Labedaea rhizosphaerae]